MHKRYKSLGLMSGTSGDGVDASLIKSNGLNEYELIKEKYFEYEPEIYRNFHKLKENVNKYQDITKLKTELSDLEKGYHNFSLKNNKRIRKFAFRFFSRFSWTNNLSQPKRKNIKTIR